MSRATDDELRSSTTESAKPEWEVIGRRLTSIRGKRTQPEMAEAIGVSKTTYGRLERGIREIGGDALSRLADLGWSPLWILTGLGAMLLPAGVASEVATDSALIVARDDVEAFQRREMRIRETGKGYAAQSAPEKASQPLRQQDAAMDAGMMAMAVRMVDQVLSKYGIRDRATSEQFAELVKIVYQDLVHGAAEDAADAALERILAIARQPQQD